MCFKVDNNKRSIIKVAHIMVKSISEINDEVNKILNWHKL